MAGSLTGALVRLGSWRGASLGLVAVTALVDSTTNWGGFRFLARALVDVPLHAVTALVLLGAITRWRGRPPQPWFCWGMLAGSVVIDVDHLPEELGIQTLSTGAPRPYTHALWVVLLLGAVALMAARRERAADQASRKVGVGSINPAAAIAGTTAGAMLGVVTHLVRDAATAPIPLWWPVSDATVQIPYLSYLIPLLLLAVLPPPRKRQDASTGERGSLTSTVRR
jgi:hypothetical protein